MSESDEDDSEGSSDSCYDVSLRLRSDFGFPLFMNLPPEMRHQIYMATMPPSGTGMNFFNIHTFPNDHRGANRSTSPPHLHLDLRRLAIDDDDQDVAKYDPSVWQIRHSLRQVCREARAACSIPADKIVQLSLTIPKRGLFVHAGDNLLRSRTPLSADGHMPAPEELIHRQVEVHVDDMVCLSVENCSFNLSLEESARLYDGRDNEEDEMNLGWAYDPQFDDSVSLGIRADRCCLNFALDDRRNLRALEEVAPELYEAATGANSQQSRPGGASERGFIMFDSDTLAGTQPWNNMDEPSVFWDRWDDAYTYAPWAPNVLFASKQLTKAKPEKEQMRTRYLRSATLRSPKRLA